MLGLTRLEDEFQRCSKTLTVVLWSLQVELILIRLVDMSLRTVFTDSHFRYIGLTGGADFNQIDGHESQNSVHRFSLYVYRVNRWS